MLIFKHLYGYSIDLLDFFVKCLPVKFMTIKWPKEHVNYNFTFLKLTLNLRGYLIFKTTSEG